MPDFPPFRLDTVNQCLWRRRETAQDERLLLTPKAFAVLRYLVEHAGQLVTQEDLLAAVWPETYIKPEVLKSRIFEIRGVLGDRPKTPRFIETLPRRGYRFIAAVHDGPAAAPALLLPSAPGHLVGREGGLETLRACLHRAMHGQRQLVLVTGEPGIGKTALVDAFQQQAAADGTGPAPGTRAMPGGLWRHGSVLPDAGSARGAVPWGWRRCGRRDPGHARTDLAGAVSRLGDPGIPRHPAAGTPGHHAGAHAARDRWKCSRRSRRTGRSCWSSRISSGWITPRSMCWRSWRVVGHPPSCCSSPPTGRWTWPFGNTPCGRSRRNCWCISCVTNLWWSRWAKLTWPPISPRPPARVSRKAWRGWSTGTRRAIRCSYGQRSTT